MARPKSGRSLPTAKQRADKSLGALLASGGRRFNLRLSKEGSDALRIIVEAEQFPDETAAINQTLIDRVNRLQKKLERRTKNGEEQ